MNGWVEKTPPLELRDEAGVDAPPSPPDVTSRDAGGEGEMDLLVRSLSLFPVLFRFTLRTVPSCHTEERRGKRNPPTSGSECIYILCILCFRSVAPKKKLRGRWRTREAATSRLWRGLVFGRGQLCSKEEV